MENASKALIMAGGILLGILILTLMVTLFASSQDVTKRYEETKKEEAIQQFNVNFTKYLGQELTIHDVITIYNFAKENGFKEIDIIKPESDFNFNINQIKKDIEDAKKYYQDNYQGESVKVEIVYQMEIEDYNEEGYVSKIKFSRINDYKITIH